MLVAADIDDAMQKIDAGVDGLDRCGDGIALLVATNGVVAHVQGQHLLVVEDVLDDDNLSYTVIFRLFRMLVLFALCLAQLRNPNSYAKLFAALRAMKYQRLSSFVLCLVEGNVVVAFGAADAFQIENRELIIENSVFDFHNPSIPEETTLGTQLAQGGIGIGLTLIAAVDNTTNVLGTTDKNMGVKESLTV